MKYDILKREHVKIKHITLLCNLHSKITCLPKLKFIISFFWYNLSVTLPQLVYKEKIKYFVLVSNKLKRNKCLLKKCTGPFSIINGGSFSTLIKIHMVKVMDLLNEHEFCHQQQMDGHHKPRIHTPTPLYILLIKIFV